MKAAFIEQFGGPDVLKYGDLPDPVAGAGEVVVDVVAASINAADWKFRAGQYARHSRVKFPQIPGRDFSGVVGATGSGADLAVGDAVFGVLDAGREGTYCEKLAVKAAIIAKKPEGLSHVNAAALALTGLTAAGACVDALRAGGRRLLDVSMAAVSADLAGPTVPTSTGLAPAAPHARQPTAKASDLGADTGRVLAELGIEAP